MSAKRLLLGLLATAATALPAAAQSVYVYPPRYYPPPYYAPPAYVPPPTYAYPPRYYAPPPARVYPAPAYPPQPLVEYDYPHRSQPGSPDRPLPTTVAPYPTPYPPPYAAVPPQRIAPPAGPPPGADLYQWMVSSIQQELAGRGYNPGPANGQMDGRTEEAIRSYQQAVGLPVTGMPSEGLLDHLRASGGAPGVGGTGAYYPPPGPPPGGGAARSDATVAWVQDALNRRGYNVGRPDGVLGQRTRQAIERFKRDSGMPVDSLINELLIERLRS